MDKDTVGLIGMAVLFVFEAILVWVAINIKDKDPYESKPFNNEEAHAPKDN